MTITSSGASPVSLTIAPGTRVLFVNNDTRPHNMTSDPHPDHDPCPEINAVGFLSPGQSRETGNLNTVRTLRLPRSRRSRRPAAAGGPDRSLSGKRRFVPASQVFVCGGRVCHYHEPLCPLC